MENKLPLERRARWAAALARQAEDREQLWDCVPGWRSWLAEHWHYGAVPASFDTDLVLLADLRDHIEGMVYLHQWQQGDRGLLAYLRRNVTCGQVLYDVGANVGSVTLPMAKRVAAQGRVFAFEPLPGTYRRLQQNLAWNPSLQMQVTSFELALSDRDGFAPLWVPAHNNAGMCSLHGPADAGEQGMWMEVALRSLDSWRAATAAPAADWVKVDVEGHELRFLCGAQALLASSRPRLLIEFSHAHLQRAGSSPQAILDFLAAWGYRPYSLDLHGEPKRFDIHHPHQNVLLQAD